MSKSQIIEEPCEVKVSCTVLKTSMGGDSLAEFNKWDWIERSNWEMVEQAAIVLSDPHNLSRMIDLEGTREMVCLDNLPPAEIACLMAAHLESPTSGEMVLPASAPDALMREPALANG